MSLCHGYVKLQIALSFTTHDLISLKYWTTCLLLMFTILFSHMYIPLSLLVEISIEKQILSINTMESHLHDVVLKRVK